MKPRISGIVVDSFVSMHAKNLDDIILCSAKPGFWIWALFFEYNKHKQSENSNNFENFHNSSKNQRLSVSRRSTSLIWNAIRWNLDIQTKLKPIWARSTLVFAWVVKVIEIIRIFRLLMVVILKKQRSNSKNWFGQTKDYMSEIFCMHFHKSISNNPWSSWLDCFSTFIAVIG